MSSPLAIGAVSAVLRNLLDDGLIQAGVALGTSVNVTAVAPDTIDLGDSEGIPRINIFLYRVTTNQAWSNVAMPSRSSATGERMTNAPLALDLHYVLTAYGRANYQAEILLGYAMHLLHERPVLDRAAVRRALDPSPLDLSTLPPAFQGLAAADLADQVELIKITPAAMNTEDMSKLWSAIQSHYRPSFAYQVSVVLIESKKPAVAALPVLSRGPIDVATQRERGVFVNPDLLPPLPTLFSTETPATQAAARLDDEVTINGVRLTGTGHRVLLAHRLFAQSFELLPVSIAADGKSLKIKLPNDVAAQAGLTAGQLALSVRFTPTGEVDPRVTNAIPLIIAPVPVIAAIGSLGLPAATAVRGSSPAVVTVTLASRPQVRLQQSATLMLDSVEANALPRANAALPLQFRFPNSVPAGARRVRLRVDGTDSIIIDHSGPTPRFDPAMQLTVPA